MNIMMTKYPFVKEKLIQLGKRIGSAALNERHMAAFWEEQRERNCDDLWESIICGYIAYGNTDEERDFIDWMFFRNSTPIEICRKFYISEKTYYIRREHIFNDILFIAAECGLITSGIFENGISAVLDTFELTEGEWREIEHLTGKSTVQEANRSTIEAAFYLELNKLPWRNLPKKYGSWNSVYKRFSRLRKARLWEKIRKALGK